MGSTGPSEIHALSFYQHHPLLLRSESFKDVICSSISLSVLELSDGIAQTMTLKVQKISFGLL